MKLLSAIIIICTLSGCVSDGTSEGRNPLLDNSNFTDFQPYEQVEN